MGNSANATLCYGIRIDVGAIESCFYEPSDIGHISHDGAGLHGFSVERLCEWIDDNLTSKLKTIEFRMVSGDPDGNNKDNSWLLVVSDTIVTADWEGLESLDTTDFASVPLRDVVLAQITLALDLPTVGVAGWKLGATTT